VNFLAKLADWFRGSAGAPGSSNLTIAGAPIGEPVVATASIDAVATTGFIDPEKAAARLQSEQSAADPIVHIVHPNGTAFPDLTSHRQSELAALRDDTA
jgi:hypothetical protein